MQTYGEWLQQQTPERQEASLAHMMLCAELGKLQRQAPYSAECAVLARRVLEYYAAHPAG
jgi:hypothetical protein